MNQVFSFFLLSFFSILSSISNGQEVLLEPSFIQKKPTIHKKLAALPIIRLQDTLQLPFIDDFSSNRLAPLDVSTSDSSYQLIHQGKYTLMNGTNFTTLANSLDSSFTTVFKSTDTTKVANAATDSLLVFDNSTYPPTLIDTFPLWNNYSLIDSLNTGTFDTLFVDSLKNDSLAIGVVAPFQNLWTDNSVRINSNYPLNAPSVGVATMDAVDYYGFLYPQGSSAAFPGDSLTSKKINLEGLNAGNNLVLSFMIEPGGIGDEPENTDKLILQFKDSAGNWIETWSSASESDLTASDFKNIYIAVAESKYLHAAFQFRLINYASLSGVSTGWQSNADQWHIDYVVLDSGRTVNDNYIQDVCFATAPSTKINGFFNVPWKHYLQNKSITKTSSEINVNNLGTASSTISFSSSIDENGAVQFQDNTTANQTLLAGSTSSFIQNYGGFQFSSTATYRTQFNTAHQLQTTGNNFITTNDTASFIQLFDQSYAHDDGTAEAGYGINSFNGQFALKYELLTSGDTLTALDIYFNNTLKQENFDIPISLQIWSDSGGEPGDTLYTGIAAFPISSDSLNVFLSYKLSRPIYVSGTIYIGWKQLSSELLNIGLDRNTKLSDKAFYKVSNAWKKSSIEGAVMLRPRFGTNTFLSAHRAIVSRTIYPNPTNHSFQIKGLKPQSRIEIYSLDGQLINVHQAVSAETTLNIEHLPTGVYILKISETDKISYTKLTKN